MFDWTFIPGLLAGAISGPVAVMGLSRWLGDVWLGRLMEKEKARYNREIEQLKAGFAQELERYKAQLDRYVFVTRAHFETELGAYKQLFEGLGQVRLAMASIRPMFEQSPEGESDTEKRKRLNERLNKLVSAHDKTVEVTENRCPFYPVDIYLKVEACLQQARGEIMEIRSGGNGTFSLEWYGRGTKRIGDFMNAYNAATETVRGRIATLAVIPH